MQNYVMLYLFPLFATVSPLIGMSPAVTNVVEGQQLTLPCVLLAGNPIPERKWIKNSIVVRDCWVILHKAQSYIYNMTVVRILH